MSEADDPDIVYIYNDKIKVKKPIQDLSPIVKVLGINNFSRSRIYIKNDKIHKLHKFLEKYEELIS